jgi:hypothetical protein
MSIAKVFAILWYINGLISQRRSTHVTNIQMYNFMRFHAQRLSDTPGKSNLGDMSLTIVKTDAMTIKALIDCYREHRCRIEATGQ